MNRQEQVYWDEFFLNLENQIVDSEYIWEVGYQIDNILLFTIVIPKRLLKQW